MFILKLGAQVYWSVVARLHHPRRPFSHIVPRPLHRWEFSTAPNCANSLTCPLVAHWVPNSWPAGAQGRAFG
jgi:hypothetical protein